MAGSLEDVQDGILAKLHEGQPVDREAVLAENPEHSEALRQFFEVLSLLEGPENVPEPEFTTLGEFRILRRIGSGGMGLVYEAEQTSLHRRVALKVLPPALSADARLTARFRREAKAAGRLRHPNIIPVFSVGEFGGTPFFAMELIEGLSLAAILRDRGEGKDVGLPPAGEPWRRWVAENLAKVADALDYAHREGILHRDVKPGNIMLEKDGTPRLTDFGLALDLGAQGFTATGESLGTVQYMSPEQATKRENPLDARTDVYSLAVTVYEALTLRLPYEGSTIPDLLVALHRGEIVPPRKSDPGMTPALEAVLLRALRMKPDERYASAADFAADLRRAITAPETVALPVPVPDPAVTATPRGPGSRAYRWIERTPIWRLLLWAVVIPCSAVLAAAIGGHFAPYRFKPAAITPSELASLAAGTLKDGPAVLSRWITPVVRLRDVVTLKNPGRYRCYLSVDGGEDFYVHPDIKKGVLVLARWELSLDGKDWKVVGHQAKHYSGGIDSSPGVNVDVASTLGTRFSEGFVILYHRAVIKVLPLRDDEKGTRFQDPGFLPSEFEKYWSRPAGTTWTCSVPTRTLFVLNDFPPGYPPSVSIPSIDEAMRRSLTPDSVVRVTLGGGATGRTVTLEMLGGTMDGPEAMASKVEWFVTGLQTALAVGEVVEAPRKPPSEGVTNLWEVTLRVGSALPTEGERALLDLTTGRASGVHLVFRPSRAVALDLSDLVRYWGGTLDLMVPLHLGRYDNPPWRSVAKAAPEEAPSAVATAPPAAPPAPTDGQPSAPPAPVGKVPLLAKSFQFQFQPNTDMLDMAHAQNKTDLEAIAKMFKVSPSSKVVLRGHVSAEKVQEFKAQGESVYRKASLAAIEMSKRRAREVRRVLIETYGIDAPKVEAEGKGWEQPLPGEPEKSRRVEVLWYTLV